MRTFIPRMHLFEFEDFAIFPSRFRNYMTDFLRHSTIRMRLHRPMVDILSRALERSGQSCIVDLCSGGGGLLAELQGHIDETNSNNIKITFTDKYPNEEALSHICESRSELSNYELTSVDATAVPSRLKGLRTMFSSFHHFKPDVAEQILADAVKSRQGIAVFEISRRTPLGFVPMILAPIGTWLMTPFIRPFSYLRLFYTYIIPVVPFFIMWDGVVSAFRTYTVEEMDAMVKSLGPTDFDLSLIHI